MVRDAPHSRLASRAFEANGMPPAYDSMHKKRPLNLKLTLD
jgi:hypothetical protein